ncbi:MAG: D-2-hydroxyacid dehydrogenase [Bacteroidetes bacterium]|nr:D-2-hydroxyacid dehydrogenase [Bacteroidota bacterium]
MKIVILDGFTTNPGDVSWESISRLGTLKVYDRTEREKVVERAKGFEVAVINKTEMTADILSQLPDLKLIAYLATGYNSVDLEAASQQGIMVANAPGYGSDSVAQHAIALLLALTNQVGMYNKSTHQGDWVKSADWTYQIAPLVELRGKKMGVVGLGRIGRRAAEMASGLGMTVIANNRSPQKMEGVRMVELEELFRESDVVSLHCPLTSENERFVNRDLLSLMKPTAYLINTGRGPLIDEEDLAEALIEGKLAGAGLDVLSSEPPAKDNPLWKAPNCIITPHIAWGSREARIRLIDIVAGNIAAFMEGRSENIVN